MWKKSNDEDIIRFDMGGTQYFMMKSGRFNVNNTGRSIFIGENAGLNDDLNNHDNVFIGTEAGTNNDTGFKNVFIGSKAGLNNTTGTHNHAFGINSLANNTKGIQNIALGASALFNNDSGSSNTVLGTFAGYNTLGNNNIFIGYNSGFNEAGSDRLYIENSNSNMPLIYGEFDNNVVRINGKLQVNDPNSTGYLLPNLDGSANQFLQTNGSGNVTWQTIPSGSDDQNISGSVLLGTNLTIGIEGGTSQAIDLSSLKSDNQNLTINNVTGQLSIEGGNSVDLRSIVDNDNDTRIQVEETADDDIIRFDMGGLEYFNMNTGRINIKNTGGSVFLGQNAGLNDDLNNRDNVFVGTSAGLNNVTGSKNIFIGSQAGIKNKTGTHNQAYGKNSLYNNFNGIQNIALGSAALFNNVAGNRNTVLGNFAGSNTLGDDNVFIGYSAGGNELGSDKLYIHNTNTSEPLIYGNFSSSEVKIYGSLGIKDEYTFPVLDGLANQVLRTDGTGNVTWQSASTDNLGNHIMTQNLETTGNWISNDGDNEGIFVKNDGNIGIGNSNPSEMLHMSSTGSAVILIEADTDNVNEYDNPKLHFSQDAGAVQAFVGLEGNAGQTALNTRGNAFMVGQLNTNSSIQLVTKGEAQVTVSQHGLVGIGTNNPTADLHIEQSFNGIEYNTGGIRLTEQGDPTDHWRIYHSGAYLSFNRKGNRVAYFNHAGTHVVTSDRRLKKEISSLDKVLPSVLKLNPVKYLYKHQEDGSQPTIGFIAQEVLPLFPELVHIDEKEEFYGMSYANTGIIAIKAIQELNEIVKKQQGQINSLLKMLQENKKQQ